MLSQNKFNHSFHITVPLSIEYAVTFLGMVSCVGKYLRVHYTTSLDRAMQ